MIRDRIAVLCLFVAALVARAGAADTSAPSVNELVALLEPETLNTIWPLAEPLRAAGATTDLFRSILPTDYKRLQITVRALREIERAGGSVDLLKLSRACVNYLNIFVVAVRKDALQRDSFWLLMFRACEGMRYDMQFKSQFHMIYQRNDRLPVKVPTDLEEIEAILGWSDEQIKQNKWHVEGALLRNLLSGYVTRMNRSEADASNKRKLDESQSKWIGGIIDACEKTKNMEELLWLVEKGIEPNLDTSEESRFLLVADICQQFNEIKYELFPGVSSEAESSISAKSPRLEQNVPQAKK